MTTQQTGRSGARPKPHDYQRCFLDMEPDFMPLYERCKPHTMTSIERMYALYKAVEHVVRSGISGDLVECGVWKGGSMMLCALALAKFGDAERRIYLYDTFEGMSRPTERDQDIWGRSAGEALKQEGMSRFGQWCFSPINEVRANLHATGLAPGRIVLVPGRVEETMPGTRPERIALLRLDTDWYESTYHELTHLYPLLSVGGVLILDDYGHWRGARQAADRYLRETQAGVLLTRIDYTGRIGVKVGPPPGTAAIGLSGGA